MEGEKATIMATLGQISETVNGLPGDGRSQEVSGETGMFPVAT
jgi:hypothetical protein